MAKFTKFLNSVYRALNEQHKKKGGKICHLLPNLYYNSLRFDRVVRKLGKIRIKNNAKKYKNKKERI